MPEHRQIGPTKPASVQNPTELPPGDPNGIEAHILDFLGGMVGDVQPNNMSSAVGGAAMMLPFDKILSLLGKGVKAAMPARKAVNVADEMLRSHELPLLDSRISGLPPERAVNGKFPEPGSPMPGETVQKEMLAGSSAKRRSPAADDPALVTETGLTPEDMARITKMYRASKGGPKK